MLDKSLPLPDPGFYERKGEIEMQFTIVSSRIPFTRRILAKNWRAIFFKEGTGLPHSSLFIMGLDLLSPHFKTAPNWV